MMDAKTDFPSQIESDTIMNPHDEELAKQYPHLYTPTKGYVFVVTYGRSGSTLTQNLLNSIPSYCIRGENGNLTYFLCRAIHLLKTQPMYTSRRLEVKLPPEQRSNYLRGILGQKFDPWYGAELADPVSFGRSLFDSFAAEILRIEPGTRVAGFKEIRFHEDPKFFPYFLEIMQDVFPNAKFVFQTRRYEDVMNSSWWKGTPVEKVRDIITAADSLFLEFAKDKDNCHLIPYECYKSAPQEVITNLFNFLGEEYDMEEMMKVLQTKLTH